jgi:hypothetical protein
MIPRRNLLRGVWYFAGICLEGYDTPNLGYESGIHMGSIHEKKIGGQKSHATVSLMQFSGSLRNGRFKKFWLIFKNILNWGKGTRQWRNRQETCRELRIAEVKFWRSATAVQKLFSVRNSAIDLVVRNIAEVRTKIADAHHWWNPNQELSK